MAIRRLSLPSKVGEYVLEFLLVVGGITGSFWIENYREDVEERRIEREYLGGILEDLGRDTLSLQALVDLQRRRIATCKALLAPLPPDSAPVNRAQMAVLGDWHQFQRTDNTLREMQGAGHFRLIRNRAIRKGLLELENHYRDIGSTQDHQRFDQYDHLLPILFETVDFEVLWQAEDARSAAEARAFNRTAGEALRTHRKLRNLLGITRGTSGYLLAQTNEAHKQVQALIAMIEAELAR